MSYIPDVFVIGAMKAGTTTLYNSVLNHPAICLTKTKEVNFFLNDTPFEKLNLLYKEQFASPALIKVDVSPNYTKRHLYPGVAARIHRANPNAKIIFIVRDPLDRLVSHLHHNLLRDRFKEGDLYNELERNNDYILTSSYYYQLEEYLRLFGEKNVLVLLFEDLKSNPQRLCKQLEHFLGVQPIAVGLGNQYSSESRYKIKFHDPVHRVAGRSLLAKLYNYVWYFLNIKVQRPQVEERVKRQIVERLRVDLAQLNAVRTLDTVAWKNFNAV